MVTRGLACRNSDSGLGLGGTNGCAHSHGRNTFSSNVRGVDCDGRPDSDVLVDIVTLDRFTESTGNQQGRNDNRRTHLDDTKNRLAERSFD